MAASLNEFVGQFELRLMWSIKGPTNTKIEHIHCYHWPREAMVLLVEEYQREEWEVFAPVDGTNTLPGTYEALERLARDLRRQKKRRTKL